MVIALVALVALGAASLVSLLALVLLIGWLDATICDQDDEMLIEREELPRDPVGGISRPHVERSAAS